MPAASLELTDDVSDQDALQLRAYRQLLFQRPELELVMGAVVPREIPGPPDADGNPTTVIPQLPASMAVGNARGSRFFNVMTIRPMQVCSRPQKCACLQNGWTLEPSITTIRSRPLLRISALALVAACLCASPALAKKTPEEKARLKDEKAAVKEASEKEKLLQVFVSEPYLELATGPGRGYPVFHVVGREESVDVLHRRTDWFKVRDEQGVEGWARAHDMRRTKLADGSPFVFNLGDRQGSPARWELASVVATMAAPT